MWILSHMVYLVRPKKKICVIQVTRPYLPKCPHPKVFLQILRAKKKNLAQFQQFFQNADCFWKKTLRYSFTQLIIQLCNILMSETLLDSILSEIMDKICPLKKEKKNFFPPPSPIFGHLCYLNHTYFFVWPKYTYILFTFIFFDRLGTVSNGPMLWYTGWY